MSKTMSDDNELLRPVIGIENRTAQEVFDIMCDRFRSTIERLSAIEQEQPLQWQPMERDAALRWLTSLYAALGAYPDFADDRLWIERLHDLISKSALNQSRT